MQILLKYLVPIILGMSLFSCEKLPGKKDYAAPAASSKFAAENKLLISRYKPSLKSVVIQNQKYNIKDSWTSYRFKSTTSTEINKDVYEFLLLIENAETGESFAKKIAFPVSDHIQYTGTNYGYSSGLGIASNLFSIDYLRSKQAVPPDTLHFIVKNRNLTTNLFFIKEK